MYISNGLRGNGNTDLATFCALRNKLDIKILRILHTYHLLALAESPPSHRP